MIHNMALDLSKDGTNNLSAERCAEIIGRFKFLKKLSIGDLRKRKVHIPTTDLLQGLPHLEHLSIYSMLDLVRSYLLYCMYVLSKT